MRHLAVDGQQATTHPELGQRRAAPGRAAGTRRDGQLHEAMRAAGAGIVEDALAPHPGNAGLQRHQRIDRDIDVRRGLGRGVVEVRVARTGMQAAELAAAGRIDHRAFQTRHKQRVLVGHGVVRGADQVDAGLVQQDRAGKVASSRRRRRSWWPRRGAGAVRCASAARSRPGPENGHARRRSAPASAAAPARVCPARAVRAGVEDVHAAVRSVGVGGLHHGPFRGSAP